MKRISSLTKFKIVLWGYFTLDFDHVLDKSIFVLVFISEFNYSKFLIYIPSSPII